MTARQWLALLARGPILPAVGISVAIAIGPSLHRVLLGTAAGLIAAALLTLATAGLRVPIRQTARTVAGLVVAVFAAAWFATHR